MIQKSPLKDYLAAISVGKVGGEIRVDLAYDEDSLADVDMNLVMTGQGRIWLKCKGRLNKNRLKKKIWMNSWLSVGVVSKVLIKIQKELVGNLLPDPRMSLRELVLATGNQNKQKKLVALLEDVGLTILHTG